MIDFYTIHSASPNVRKIMIMLAETGLPHAVRRLDKSGGRLPDSFFVISPNGTVPAIVDHASGQAVFESAAILQYLAEKAGKLLPSSPIARADVIKWLIFEASNVGPVMGELFHYLVKTADDISEVHLQRYRDKLASYCAILDQQLANKAYLCGDYSIADIALYPWSAVMEDMAEISLSDYPNLSGWAARIDARPAAKTVLGGAQ